MERTLFILIVYAAGFMSSNVLAQDANSKTTPALNRSVHFAAQVNLATSKMSGESWVYPMNRITRAPLTVIGLIVWSGETPFTGYVTAGIKMGNYQLTNDEYRDRLALYWGYFGVGAMIGPTRFKFYSEFNPMFILRQDYTVFARETYGRHWVHASDLDLFPKWQYRLSLGFRYRISDWWVGAYHQFSLKRTNRPNILQAKKLNFRSYGVSVWIPIAKITW